MNKDKILVLDSGGSLFKTLEYPSFKKNFYNNISEIKLDGFSKIILTGGHAKLFKNHMYKRSCTRVWKPVGSFENRWRYFNNDGNNIEDQELARGGLFIRVQKDHPINITDKNGTSQNWNYMPQTVLFDVEATVYMHYKDRI